MEFIKTYGGWITSGLLVAVILFLLFRPVPAPDNTAATHRIDSLLKVNSGLNKDLAAYLTRTKPTIDSLSHATDSLAERGIILSLNLDASLSASYSLAKQVQYYKAHRDTVSYDSACDLLAQKAISDSIVIVGYQSNTTHIISAFGAMVEEKDSIIGKQTALILSDSVIISQQKDLSGVKDAQIKKLVKQGKMVAWIGRSLAVVVAGLSIALFAR